MINRAGNSDSRPACDEKFAAGTSADDTHSGFATNEIEKASALEVLPLAAFNDNYLWLIHNGRESLIVDPGDAVVVERALAARNLKLAAILVTHHHPDHIGGVMVLKSQFDIPVYGPRAEAAKIEGLTHLLEDADCVSIEALDLQFDVLAVPGHTLGHIAYYAARQGWLFCGDTLFASGCGRLFEGTPAQMQVSLQKLAQLPPQTGVFCAHEYTLSNLAFARAVEPGNAAIAAEIERVKSLRAQLQPSVPSTIARERSLNPFLRCGEVEIAKAAGEHARKDLRDPIAVFAELRSWKDDFRAS
jgi:hydroxyacylglutathione hydrolase